MHSGSNWSYAVKGRLWGRGFIASCSNIKDMKQYKKRAFRTRVRQALHKALLDENYDELDFTPSCPYTDWDVW